MKILIVDDDENSRVLQETALKAQAYTVESSVNGKQALEVAKRSHPDLIISDILMPEMDGFALCRAVKGEEQLRTIPFIFHTASYITPEDKELAKALGATRFIVKTGNMEKFLKTIKEILKEYEEKSLQVQSQLIVGEEELERMHKEALVRQLDKKVRELEKEHEELEKRVLERTAKLSEARDRIDGILKSIADGLLVTDVHNYIVLMNRAAEDMLGIRLSEVIDKPIDSAIKDKTLRDGIKSTLDKKEAGYKFDFKLPSSLPNKTRVMRARTSGILDKEGKLQGIVTIISDVTKEREIDRMKTEFLSTAAHELRTPLTSIQGFSEIVLTRDNISPEERKKFMKYINQQAVALSAIIKDLLDISRIETGEGTTLYKQQFESGDAIKVIVKYFQEQYPKCQFEVVVPEKSVEVLVDKEKMDQVLKNILSNAVKYSPEGGLIRITGKVIEDYFQVSVEDHGIGMTPEQIDKIYDKFYRADASNTAVEGTGLGMSIVKYIVEIHGGKVWVESEYGKGTTVTYKIPLS